MAQESSDETRALTVRVNDQFIYENLAKREEVMAGLLQFDLENCANYGTKLQLEKDFLEWSFYIVINKYLKLNVSIQLEEGHISTQLYKDCGDGTYYPDRRSPTKEHTEINSIASEAEALIWWFNKE